MTPHALSKFWSLIYSTVQEFCAITEPAIEEAAISTDVPVELYYYAELGLEYFSIEEFQKRDPFSNPEQFEKQFVRLNVKGWIEPIPDDRFSVPDSTRKAVKSIIESGDACLPPADLFKDIDLERLKVLIKQIVLAIMSTDSSPGFPQRWAVFRRFRVATRQSPVLVKIREYLMDLFAYRDDSHLTAARPHFNQAGIVWSTLGAVSSGSAVTAARMAETMAFRGYEVEDYDIALRAAKEIGWIEESDSAGSYRLTERGTQLREQVEAKTDEYFYQPWSALTHDELDELYDLLTKLRDRLRELRKKQ